MLVGVFSAKALAYNFYDIYISLSSFMSSFCFVFFILFFIYVFFFYLDAAQTQFGSLVDINTG